MQPDLKKFRAAELRALAHLAQSNGDWLQSLAAEQQRIADRARKELKRRERAIHDSAQP